MLDYLEKLTKDEHSSLFGCSNSVEEKKFCNTATSGQFHKYFMHVTYGSGKISCTVHCMHVSMQYCQNALPYFVTAVSWGRKMFM
jgi:hypothetical protein